MGRKKGRQQNRSRNERPPGARGQPRTGQVRVTAPTEGHVGTVRDISSHGLLVASQPLPRTNVQQPKSPRDMGAVLRRISRVLTALSNRLDVHASKSTSGREVPKVPRLVQNEIDRLIEKGKTDGLSTDEQAQLNEALDYLDDLTTIELERLKVGRE